MGDVYPLVRAMSNGEYLFIGAGWRRFYLKWIGDDLFIDEELPSPYRQFLGRTYDAPELRALMRSPNTFMRRLSEIGIERDEVVFRRSRLANAMIPYTSMREAYRAIEAYIDANTWYDDREAGSDDAVVEPHAPTHWSTPHDASTHATRNPPKRAMTESDRRRIALQEADTLPGIFKGCHSMSGAMSEPLRERVLNYLNAPTEQGWLAIADMPVTMDETFHEAWVALEPTRQTEDETVPWPTPRVLIRAMQQAVDRSRRLKTHSHQAHVQWHRP